jgi:hypothetical protein
LKNKEAYRIDIDLPSSASSFFGKSALNHNESHIGGSSDGQSGLRPFILSFQYASNFQFCLIYPNCLLYVNFEFSVNFSLEMGTDPIKFKISFGQSNTSYYKEFYVTIGVS